MWTFSAAIAFAQEPPASEGMAFSCRPEDWPEADRGRMVAARARGLTLAQRDAWAWKATDRVYEQATVPDIGGYVVAETADGAEVHFFRADDPQRVVVAVVFDAARPEGRVVRPRRGGRLKADSPLASAHRAGLAALHDDRFVPKAARYNRDVLPWSDQPADGWAVYFIPGAADYAEVPLGGGYLARVSADGRTVEQFTALTESVLQADVAALRSGGGGTMVTTVLTPYPDASYVAWASIWEVPLVVVTPQRVTWLIRGEVLCRAELPPDNADE